MDPGVAYLINTMVRISSAPVLRTVNGFGFRLCGTLALPGLKQQHLAAHWFVAFFLPVLPLGLYVVSGNYPGPYKFYGRVRFRIAVRAYGSRIWWLLASAWLHGIAMLTFVGLVVASFAGGISSLR